MQRPVCALLLLAAASCAEITSESELCTAEESAANDPKCGRPLELAYITSAIFIPSCGQTQCHSTFRKAGGLAFDNARAAALSLLAEDSGPLLRFDSNRHDPTRVVNNEVPHLLRWITEDFPLGEADNARMPFDAPLAEADVELIRVWIQEEIRPGDLRGREPRPGASARGAQCNPDAYDGFACTYDSETGDFLRVRCNDNFNFGAIEERCTNACTLTEVSGRRTAVCT